MSGIVLLVPIVLPLAAGLAMFGIKKLEERRLRDRYVTAVLLVCAAVAAYIVLGPQELELHWQMSEDFLFCLKADGLAKIFLALVSLAWMCNGFFAFEYMSREERQEEFFGFYLVCYGFVCGVALSGGFPTMQVFYIITSIACVPLLMHRRTSGAIQASVYYMVYFAVGQLFIHFGGKYIMRYMDSEEFVEGGSLNLGLLEGHEGMFMAMVFLLLLGFGIKACVFPFHNWHKVMTQAAPMPAVSAISGILTKIGVIAMIRVTCNMTGMRILRGTWVQTVWIILALLSIFIGAVLAFRTSGLSERLAYSTVGQVGCIVFGVASMCPDGMTGAIVLMIAHTMAFLVLFFTTGAIYFHTGYTQVDQLRGIGKKIPHMMFCFALASCVLMGIPPTLGFVGDWYATQGALATISGSVAAAGSAVFLIGELFAAGYLLPIVLHGFFPGEEYSLKHEKVKVPSLYTRIPAYLLTVVVYALGFFPVPLITFIHDAVSAMTL